MVGKNTIGADYWYNDNNTKVGSIYPTNGETINVIYARLWNTGYMDAVVKAVIYDATTHAIVAISDEVFIPVTQTTSSYITFPLPSEITLPIGNCIFSIHIGKGPAVPEWAGTALNFGYSGTAYVNGIRNIDLYSDGPSSIFEASDPNAPTTYNKDFDIYAQLTGTGPTANFGVSPQNVKSGQQMTFDASLSVQGASPIQSYAWEFGDGQIGQGLVAIHTYSPITTTAYTVKLTVTDGAGLSHSVSYIVGVFNLGPTIIADFEKSTDFMSGDNSIWEPSSWPLLNPNNILAPETGLPLHPGGSGITCARVSCLDPSQAVNGVDGHRLELLHRWDPLTTRDMWLEAWVYVPVDYVRTIQKDDILRPIYERCWIGGYEQMFNGVNFGLWLDSYRPGRPTYMQQVFLITLGQGDVDGGGLTYEDFVPSDTDPTIMPPFGQWFYVRFYVYRDPSNWNNGTVRIWMALPPDYTIKLILDRSPVRTIGINPNLIAQATPKYMQEGYFCSGFSNYVSLGDPSTTIYFDRIVLSGVPLGPVSNYWSVNVSASPENEGLVSPSGNVSVIEGQFLTVTATPYSGYKIDSWEFDGISYPASANFTILAQAINTGHMLIAHFSALLPTAHLLTIDSNVSGFPFTLNGASQVTPYSATLADGNYNAVMPSNVQISGNIYNFTSWSDQDTNPSKTINLTADTTLTASYTLQPALKGSIEIHSFLDGQEVVLPGLIIETGETFNTPTTLEESPGTYNVKVTLNATTSKQLTAPVTEGQTTRLDFQFTTQIPPIPPLNSLLPIIILGGITLLSSSGKKGRG